MLNKKIKNSLKKELKNNSNNSKENINSKNSFKNNSNNSKENINSKNSFKKNFIYFLENKHVPIFGRFYRTFFILLKDKNNKKVFWINFFIIIVGLIFIATCLTVAILSLTEVIDVNFSGSGDEYFSAAFLAIALIIGIII